MRPVARSARSAIRRRAAALVEVRRRQERETLAARYDWYGLSCPCGLPPGDCREHPRARPTVLRDGRLFGQRPPAGDWKVWLYAGGRGVGKTRTGAEWIRDQVENHGARHVALVSETSADVRDVMIEGPAGLLAVAPPWFKPVFSPANRSVTWPNGAKATLFSAERPDQLRGPQHDIFWCDELAKWRFFQQETFDNLEFGLRLGQHPRGIVTTTPRPTPTYRSLIRHPGTAVTQGTTFENERHLPDSFLRRIRERYGNTRIGRQEIEAELLEDTPGALWNNEIIEADRLALAGGQVTDLDGNLRPVEFVRVVVAIDPAIGSADPESGAEAGIVVAALGSDGHAYVIEDCSLKGSPQAWSSVAVDAYHRHAADRIVAEVNNGGAMVESVLRTADDTIPFKKLWASRGKMTRAEPVASLYERHRVHHVGVFPELEGQMCGWVPGMPSPDRMDALVWGITELALEGFGETEIEEDPYHGERI